MKTIVLEIDGMKCGMCESHVNDAVRRVANVKKVSSSHTKNQTEIVAEDFVVIDDILTAITEQGYRITSQKVLEYRKKGLFDFIKSRH